MVQSVRTVWYVTMRRAKESPTTSKTTSTTEEDQAEGPLYRTPSRYGQL